MKNKQKKELAVCGLAAVQSLAKENPQKVQRLYFTAEHMHLFGDLCKSMAARKAPYNQVSNEKELQKLSGSIHHQGVVAMIDIPKIEFLSPVYVQAWVSKNENALLLDHIGNANNFGAIIRSAAFFGIKNIIIPINEKQSSITTSSYRVAQGGMEFVTVLGIRSIPALLEDVKNKMIRVGTDVNGTTLVEQIASLQELKNTEEGSKKKNQPFLVALGNEEVGLSQAVKAHCDYVVKIPTPVNALDSLNVAQAAAIILYEMSKID